MTRMSERDGCLVDSAGLAGMVTQFVDAWKRDRPSTAGRFAGAARLERVEAVSAVAWLATESGLSEETVVTLKSGRRRAVELRDADALVSAIGRPDAFHDGTLRIRPNPRARPERRAECCSGSLNGSLT